MVQVQVDVGIRDQLIVMLSCHQVCDAVPASVMKDMLTRRTGAFIGRDSMRVQPARLNSCFTVEAGRTLWP